MTKEISNSANSLRKKNYIIIALAIALVVCIFLLFVDFAGHAFGGPVDNNTAIECIGKYRNPLIGRNKRTRIVYYDADAIRRYLDYDFPRLTNLVRGLKDTSYHWKVGFYFMKEKIKGDSKLSFFVVPVLVDSAGNVADFYDYPGKDSCYWPKVRTTAGRLGDGGGDSLAFNTGHLWP